MYVDERIEVPPVTTADATPVRLGKSYFQYQAVTRIEAVIFACNPVNSEAATWLLQYSYVIVDPFNIPYQVGSGIRTKESYGANAALWDVAIVSTWNEEDDVNAKFWFEITGQAATTLVWGGRAKISVMDLMPWHP